MKQIFRAFKLIALAFAAVASSMQTMSASAVENPNLLWYDRPAANWEQALPVGDGRLDAMIFGQPEKGRLQLNEVTILSGGPVSDADRKDAYKNLSELRRLLHEGTCAEAEKFANANFNGLVSRSASAQTKVVGDDTLVNGEKFDWT